MHPKNLSIVDFTYQLPDDKIAKYPLAERDSSRLLVYKDHTIEESLYRNLHEFLPSGSLLLFNNTKVIEARLLFRKQTGAVVEIFCLEPCDKKDIASAMSQTKHADWLCLIGGASKWKPGQILSKEIQYKNDTIVVEARFVEKVGNSFAVNISWVPQDLTFAEVLHLAGAIPLPPYIKREADISDTERYQTVYAIAKGSVAAPTAGLHFTPAMLRHLESKLETAHLTLHVGAGTFKPVKSTTIEHHEMHSEFIEISDDTINKIYEYHDRFITAVGTTSFRTIESIYWMGVKIALDEMIAPDQLAIGQWDAYLLESESIPVGEAIQALLSWMKRKNLATLITKTQLMVAPGYKVKLVKALVTNFHQPQSTLLLLVAAFVGDDWRKIYDYALQHEFRFLSYGDGCLLFRNSSFS